MGGLWLIARQAAMSASDRVAAECSLSIGLSGKSTMAIASASLWQRSEATVHVAATPGVSVGVRDESHSCIVGSSLATSGWCCDCGGGHVACNDCCGITYASSIIGWQSAVWCAGSDCSEACGSDCCGPASVGCAAAIGPAS